MGAFLLLQACLGPSADAVSNRISIVRPHLPAPLDKITIRGLTVGEASVDLLLKRHKTDVAVTVLDRSGDVVMTIVRCFSIVSIIEAKFDRRTGTRWPDLPPFAERFGGPPWPWRRRSGLASLVGPTFRSGVSEGLPRSDPC